MRKLFILIALFPLHAFALTMDMPIACTLGKDCYIQNFVDTNSGPDYEDYTCGPLSYDGHKGTDFRLLNYVQMREGVNVLNADNGTVRNIRDGMEDISIRKGGREAVKGKECGNGVVVTHEGGYEVQYCHMMKGSIQVTPGQPVRIGDVLGKVGISGDTEFPHLHVEVRKDGQTVDPFIGPDPNPTCDSPRNPIWVSEIQPKMRYIPTGQLGHGFADSMPDAEGAREGNFSKEVISPDAEAIIFWVDLFGIRKGDALTMRLESPSGVKLVENTQMFDNNKAQVFQMVGKKKGATRAWQPGKYEGFIKLLREGSNVPLIEDSWTVTVK